MKFSFFITLSFVTFSNFVFGQSTGASELYEPIEQYSADYWALQRKYTLKYSDEYYSRFTDLFQSWQNQLSQIDFDGLSQQGKADFVLLNNHLEKENYFLQIDYEQFKRVKHSLDGLEPLFDFVRKRRRGSVPEYEQLAKQMSQITVGFSDKKEEMKALPYNDWMDADKARLAIESLAENVKEAFDFYNAYDPMFTWWMEKPHQQLQETLKDYAGFLGENYDDGMGSAEFLEEGYSTKAAKDDGSGIVGKPIGEEAIIKSLEYSFIPYKPDELIKAAEEQFQYCEAEMLKASRELGYGTDWKAALEHVKNTYVPPGQQPAIIDSLAWEAVHFIEERDLITIPELAKETWRMKMMSPERQLVSPFFLGGETIIISYPTNTMTHDQKMMSMRGNNPNFSTATVHHELIPGHHMQMFMASRYKPYRNLFYNPFWMEGWALYWEINLWNLDFPDTPEERIGMLFWRMHRCARIIFSLSYHMNKMTPQECIDMLVNRVGHEYANAEAEVRRSFTGGYGPLYQLAYMTGGLQFYALKKEMLAEGWTEKQFHDAVMREGNIPIEILRAILKKEEIKKNFKTKWRFSMDFE